MGARHYKGSFTNESVWWGSHLTADWIASKEDSMLGVGKMKHLFVIGDLWSGLWHAFPTRDRTTESASLCFKECVGARHLEVHQLYSDYGREIKKAMRMANVLSRIAQPGDKKSNSLVERHNREIESTG